MGWSAIRVLTQARPVPIRYAFLIGLVATAGYTILEGQDLNWDFKNYHFAAGYFLLTGDWERAIAPSQVQSWFNPLGYVPAYLLTRYCPPLMVEGILCACAAWNVVIVARLHERAAGGSSQIDVFAGAILAATGALFLGVAGTTFLDSIVTIPVLAGLLLLLPRQPQQARSLVVAWAVSGALIGAATGLKLTLIPVMLGCLAAAILRAGLSRDWRGLAVWIAALAVGALATGGWWHAAVWQETGNPLFPAMNMIFHSPWGIDAAMTDPRFVPGSAGEAVLYPVLMAIGHGSSPPDHLIAAEPWFRDPRYLIGLGGACWLLGCNAVAWLRGRATDIAELQLSLFFLVAWSVWIAVFAIGRYIIALEMIGGVIAILAARRTLAATPHIAQGAIVAMTVLLLVISRPASWERVPFTDSWIGLRGVERLPAATYVQFETEPTAFLIPFLPRESRFVRLSGNFTMPADRELGRRARAGVASSRLPLRTLATPEAHQHNRAVLAQFGLRIIHGTCMSVTDKDGETWSCELLRERSAGIDHDAG